MRLTLSLLTLFAAVFLVGCRTQGTEPVQDGAVALMKSDAKPLRVVSLDYCADQYVLKLLPKDRIGAVSRDAGKSFSYMRDAAEGVPAISPRAESVLSLKPDLIVRSYGGGAGALNFYERLGIPVLQLSWISDLDGAVGELMRVAEVFGEAEAGAILVEDFQDRLQHARSLGEGRQGRSVLYVTPGGVTAGAGTLVDEIVKAAGQRNFETRTGWYSLPLERMVNETPDILALSFFEQHTLNQNAWSAARHPIVQSRQLRSDAVSLDGAWTACGGWYLIDAVEALGRNKVE